MCESEGTGLGESREQAVQAELKRLMESAAFRSSKRCREFLEYIVEYTVKGPSGALKERSIGVNLFQLTPDFDTGQHTVVRVTANEVRKRLAQYYLAENGSYHQVRIDLPPGSYSAEFRWQRPAAEVRAAETPTPARSWLTRRVIGCAAALLVIASAFGVWYSRTKKPVPVSAKSTLAAGSVATVSSGSEDLRMIVGSANPYIDRSGRTWGPGPLLFRRFCASPSV